MLGPIPYTPKQETIKQVCSSERAWMELLPQMGNFNWGPIWCNNLVSKDVWVYLLSIVIWKCCGYRTNSNQRPCSIKRPTPNLDLKNGMLFDNFWKSTVMILNFWRDRSEQTVQTQIRLLLEEQSDQGLHCLPFRLHCLDSLLYGRAT